LPNTEKRKYPRIRIYSLISYACLDNDEQVLGQSYGTALDISQGGLLLETVSVIETEYVLLTIIDMEDKVMELKGKVAYCKKTDSGKYRTGVSFQGTKKKNIQFASTIVRTYHSQKNKN
jgi:Tfp pilus assembly protein PilZ